MIKKTLNLMIISFFLVGSFAACSKKVCSDDEIIINDDEVVIDDEDEIFIDPLEGRNVVTTPQEVILGKWDRIADAMYVNKKKLIYIVID